MKTIEVGRNVVVWVAERVAKPAGVNAVGIGVAIDGEIIGGVIFDDWTGPNIEATVAGEPRAWTRAFLRRLGAYAFEELGCIRVTIRTEQQAVCTYAERLGAMREGVMRSFYGPGRDAVVYGLLAQDWRLAR
jgi:RimJ/RimL family protein N-acetyltransferase